MKLLRTVFLGLAALACCATTHGQNGCTPSDPSGYFEGTATSKEAGKLEVSLNVRCAEAQYVGELTTPVGTYNVRSGKFEAGELHLALQAGSDAITVDARFQAGALHGTFTSADDSGPLELRRVGDFKASAAETPLTKQQWHEDLAFFARELPKTHANAFHSISRERFESEVKELDRNLDKLNSDETYIGMDRLANLIGDAHTYIVLPTDDADFPIDIQRFGDDYRVVAATAGHEGILGARVLSIGETPIARAHEQLLSLTPPGETSVLRDSRATVFLTIGMLLHGIGIIPDRNSGRYTVVGEDGKQFVADIHPLPIAERSNVHWIYASRETPLFRQKEGETFWVTYLPDSRTVYCNFRGYKELATRSKELFNLIGQQHPDKLVVDMRQNGGGDYAEGLKYMVRAIAALREINQKGHLFILIGANTFSAAMSNAAQFRTMTHATLVGQQIGERPNSYQEAREMKLPSSQWTVRYSVKFYTFVENGENVVRPDKEITPSWDDYKAGGDPALDWVLRYGH